MTQENQLSLSSVDLLRKQNQRLKILVCIMAFSALLLVIIYIYNHWQEHSKSFVGRNDDTTSLPNMHNYRRGIHFNRRSMGVYYDPQKIASYLKTTWPTLIKEQEAYQTANNISVDTAYKWVVGFYWMMKKDSSTLGKANKLDFYVIPTLARKDTTIDYFEDDGKIYYHGDKFSHPVARPFPPPPPPTGPAFDEGQLFP